MDEWKKIKRRTEGKYIRPKQFYEVKLTNKRLENSDVSQTTDK